jgi:hypothetical protein
MMMFATHIFLLPEWENSKGASTECLIAKRLDLVFIDQFGMRIDSPSVKETAQFLGAAQATADLPVSWTPLATKFNESEVLKEWTDEAKEERVELEAFARAQKQPEVQALGKKNIAMEGIELTNTARMKDYGHPKDDFKRTTGALSAFGYRRINSEGEIRELEAYDFPIIMNVVKLSRLINTITKEYFHEDSLKDGVGYYNTLVKLYEDENEI